MNDHTKEKKWIGNLAQPGTCKHPTPAPTDGEMEKLADELSETLFGFLGISQSILKFPKSKELILTALRSAVASRDAEIERLKKPLRMYRQRGHKFDEQLSDENKALLAELSRLKSELEKKGGVK